MEQLKIPINLKNEEYRTIAMALGRKDYTNAALPYFDYRAKSLNQYKTAGVLPERSKKSKFNFVELVWLKMVSELRNIGVDFELIKYLKDFLFTSIDKKEILQTFESKKKELDVLLQNLSDEEKEIFNKEYKKLITTQELHFSPLMIIIVNCIFKRMPVDFRLYLNGSIGLHSDYPDGDLIPLEPNPVLQNKSFISISLTEIISYYLANEITSPVIKQSFFSKEQLAFFATIGKEKLKSLKITYKNAEPEFVEIEKEKTVAINQRLSEVFLNNAYEDVIIKTQNGKIVSCKKVTKVKLNTKNTG